MKKLLTVLVCVFVLAATLSMTAFAASDRVMDGADLLTDTEEAALMAKLDTISETYQVDVVVVTTLTTKGEEINAYTKNFYNANGYGFGETHDGVMLMISMEERDWCIDSVGFCQEALDSSVRSTIGDAVANYLSIAEYDMAFNTFADECQYYIDGAINGFPFKFGKNLLIALAIGIGVALLVTGNMKSKLKSVRKQAAAADYVKAGSMYVAESRDYFMYSQVSRTAKSSSSGSSGGSSGGGHSSTSGKF